MKKTLLPLVAFVATVCSAKDPFHLAFKPKLTDNPFRLGLQIGSACGMRTMDFGQSTVYSSTGFNVESERRIYGSFGRGIVMGLFLNYMMAEYWGFSLGYNRLLGYRSDYHMSTNNSNYSDAERVQGFYNALFLHVLLKTCCEGKLNGYGEFGPSLMLSSGYEETYEEHQDGNELRYSRERYKNRMGLGLSGNVGAMYSLSERLALGLFLNAFLFSGKLKSAELLESRVNGTDQMPNLKESQKNANFHDELDKNSNNPFFNPNFNQDKASDFMSSANGYNSLIWGVRLNMSF